MVTPKALLKRESQFSIQRHELSKPQHSTITVSTHFNKVASGGSHQNHEWHQEVLEWQQEVQFLANFYTVCRLFENDRKKLPIRKKFLFLSFPTQNGNCMNGNALTGSAIQKSHR